MAALEPIAIIGAGCRFPGAPDLDAFWEVLLAGRCTTSPIPEDRWDVAGYFDPTGAAAKCMRASFGGFLDDVWQFDPRLFRLSQREVEGMDPQQCLVLDVAWQALEHAGLAPDRLAGSRTGVFVGASSWDYAQLRAEQVIDPDIYSGTGTALALIANRVSHRLDLRGPSFTVDTACSSASVAIHLACGSLRSGESDLALAGGVNVLLHPSTFVAFSRAHMISTGPACRTFDADADGYVRAEGCGVVVLKRLTEALRDRDSVLAVLLGSALNQDGNTPGIAAPNGESQKRVMQEALAAARIPAARVDYVEAHGTGTALGDAVELASIQAVYGVPRAEDELCVVGSCKTNFGHSEAAAGVAGVLKAALCLSRGAIPRHLHLTTPNAALLEPDCRLFIPTETIPWEPGRTRRCAGVSAFGFGGANAHLILSEPPRPSRSKRSTNSLPNEPLRSHHLMAVSGQSESALVENTARIATALGEASDQVLAESAAALLIQRSRLPHRACAVVSMRQRAAGMAALTGPESAPGRVSGRSSPQGIGKAAFLFTGQGSQYPGMAAGLLSEDAGFQRDLKRCEEILRDDLPRPLLEYLLGTAPEEEIHRTEIAQPALFAVNWAMARLWMRWGLQPDAVLGHSVGEYPAACIAGIFELEAGLKLVAERGRLCAGLPSGGGMAAVQLPPERLSPFLKDYDGRLSVATYNGPGLVVISGDVDALDDFTQRVESDGVWIRRLSVRNGFHSHRMDPIVSALAQQEASIPQTAPSIPMVSNLTGEWLASEAPRVGYWAESLRSPVRFDRCVQTLVQHGVRLFLEVGPRPDLCGLLRRLDLPGNTRILPSIQIPRPGESPGNQDWPTLLGTVGRLWVAGADLNWSEVEPSDARATRLPRQAIERREIRPAGWQRLSPGAPPMVGGRPLESAPPNECHPLLGTELSHEADGARAYTFSREGAQAATADHRVMGRAIVPGVVMAEALLAAARVASGRPLNTLKNLSLTAPIGASSGDSVGSEVLSVAPEPSAEGSWRAQLRGTPPTSPDERQVLLCTEPGVLSSLLLRPHPRTAPDAGEVEVEVRAAGLNFMDLMKALGIYPNVEGLESLGSEFAGVVSRTGPGVESHAVGDPVVGVQLGALATHVTVRADQLTRLPAELDFVQAAALPVAFTTALYAMENRGRIQPGETILIHSAAGGVGLAAIQVARAAGARVFATAGTPERRDYLLSLGVELALDSRSTEFAATVRAATAGRGVDLVLNSAPGEIVRAGLEILAVNGRFLEIGRVSVYDAHALDLSLLKRGIGYHVVDMNLVAAHSPNTYMELLSRLGRGLAEGWFVPLPAKSYPLERAEDAFRDMRDRRYVGKLVLRPTSRWDSGVRHAAAIATEVEISDPPCLDIREVAARCTRQRPGDEFYGILRMAGLDYGPNLTSIERGSGSEVETLALLHLEPRFHWQSRFCLPPAILDGALQSLALLALPSTESGEQLPTLVPHFVESITVLGPVSFKSWAHARLSGDPRRSGDGLIRVDLDIANLEGRVAVQLRGLHLAELAPPPPEARDEVPPQVRVPRWVPSPKLDPTVRRPGAWLVLSSNGADAEQLVQALQPDTAAFSISFSEDPEAPLDPVALSEVAEQTTDGFAGVVYLEAGFEADQSHSDSNHQAADRSSLYRFVRIGSQLAATFRGAWCLLVVTRGAESTGTVGEPVELKPASALRAVAQVLSREYDRIDVATLDMDPLDPCTPSGPLLRDEIDTCWERPGFQRWGARRGGQRLHLELEPAPAAVDARLPWPNNPVILVTGGQGGIGRELAAAIAQEGPCRLALVNRSEFSAEHHPERKEGLDRLRSLGADVLLLHGDMVVEADVARVVAATASHFGGLHGVIHAAGSLQPALISNTTRDAFETPFLAKVDGASLLHAATLPFQPSMFLLCSSIAALVGGAGSAGYSAANALQNAFAEWRTRRSGLRTLSIMWGPWSETGLLKDSRFAHELKRRELEPLKSARGAAFLRAAMKVAAPVVACFDLSSGYELRDLQRASSRAGAVGRGGAGSPHDPRYQWLLGLLRQEVASTLRTTSDQISEDSAFVDLGFDSLMAVEVAAVVKRDFQAELNPAALFEHPTLAALTAYLMEEHGPGVTRAFERRR